MHLLTKSIKKSLQQQDWYTALFISLAVPGVCGSFYDSGDSDQKEYSRWFNQYMAHQYKELLSGEDCFILQQASLFRMISFEKLSIAEKFHFILPGTEAIQHKTYVEGVLFLDISQFCIDICHSFEAWLEDVRSSRKQQHYLEKISKTSEKIFGL